MPLFRLDHHDASALAPKAAALARLRAAGLPVPEGIVVDLGPRDGHAWSASLDDPAVARLCTGGPVIVRSALALEDTAVASGAGLGLSIADCTDLAAIRDAVARVHAHRSDPIVASTAVDDGARDQAILQRQVQRRALVAIADHPDGVDAQVHEAAGDVLGGGASPSFAGALERWPDRTRAAVQALVTRVRAALPPSPHGLELEIVVDPADVVHLVQARPFVAPLHPDAATLLAEARAIDPDLDLRGRLVLDAEHNPAPLSPAHAWLMAELARARPAAGDPTVLAGWLYVRVLPRALSGHAPAALDPRAALDELARVHLPAARRRLHDVVATADRGELPSAFAAAIAAFFAMIDVYLDVLVPARAGHRAAMSTGDRDAPLSLRGRDEFLDVLPAAWDLASPSLAELGVARTNASPSDTAIPDDASAATLLAEWDDHLFALGLAPLRVAILRAGDRLAIGDDAFFCTPPELLEALAHGDRGLASRIAARKQVFARAASLRPPLVLEDGRPVATPALGRLRGIPIGPSRDGVLAPRRDLADLLARPPGPDAIVTLPALTAPAAVALHRAGVRAVCCEHGGALSHAALMARELGVSALIGCRGCTQLPEGTRARVDTTTGRLRVATTT